MVDYFFLLIEEPIWLPSLNFSLFFFFFFDRKSTIPSTLKTKLMACHASDIAYKNQELRMKLQALLKNLGMYQATRKIYQNRLNLLYERKGDPYTLNVNHVP